MKIKKFENFTTEENAEYIFEEFIEQYKLKGWIVSKHIASNKKGELDWPPIYFAEFETEKQIWYLISSYTIEIFFFKRDFGGYKISEDDYNSIYSDFLNINKRMERFGFDVTGIERIPMDSFYSDGAGRGDIIGEYLYFEY